ncbi:MAG: MBL fold metallo-hydrolase [bacterium]
MQIQWLGQSCFKIQTKHDGNDITLITNPIDESCGLKSVRSQADIVIMTDGNKEKDRLADIKGEPFIIKNSGEYETKDIFFYGVPVFPTKENGAKKVSSIFNIKIEGLHLAFLGDLNSPLNAEQLDRLSNIDILFVPIGGNGVLNAEAADKVINEIEPRVVIPTNYHIEGLKIKADSSDIFIKTIGISPETVDKFKISKKELDPEKTKVILFNI